MSLCYKHAGRSCGQSKPYRGRHLATLFASICVLLPEHSAKYLHPGKMRLISAGLGLQ